MIQFDEDIFQMGWFNHQVAEDDYLHFALWVLLHASLCWLGATFIGSHLRERFASAMAISVTSYAKKPGKGAICLRIGGWEKKEMIQLLQ